MRGSPSYLAGSSPAYERFVGRDFQSFSFLSFEDTMRKLHLLPVLLFSLTSCRGAEGPMGPAGPQGPTGATGPSGSLNRWVATGKIPEDGVLTISLPATIPLSVTPQLSCYVTDNLANGIWRAVGGLPNTRNACYLIKDTWNNWPDTEWKARIEYSPDFTGLFVASW